MEEQLFDIVVCLGPSDEDVINSMIYFTKKNIVGYRNIYLVSCNPNVQIEGTITIDERIFPFTIDDVARIHGKNQRNGWYLQQMLKLYCGNVIEGILDKYLVVDADTHFLKPTKFISDDNKYFYGYSTEYTLCYFDHMNRLHPELKKISPYSGIAHHMLFVNEITNELIQFVEKHHGSTKPFWEIFFDKVEFGVGEQGGGCGASEYEIYVTYLTMFHSEKFMFRKLTNARYPRRDFTDAINSDNDCVSFHWWCDRFSY